MIQSSVDLVGDATGLCSTSAGRIQVSDREAKARTGSTNREAAVAAAEREAHSATGRVNQEGQRIGSLHTRC